MAASNRLLIVEDDESIKEMVAIVARNLGYDVTLAQPLTAAAETYRKLRPTLIVLDLMMPDIDGVQVLRSLAREKCEAGIILMSAVESRVLDATARIADAHGLRVRETIKKPVTIDALHAVLGKYLIWPPPITADDLREAIAQGEIVVVFQPKVDLSNGPAWAANAVEALARWNHPKLGVVAPEDFIPLAEKRDLIGRVTEIVIAKALSQAAELRKFGHAIGMAINLSPQLLDDADVPETITKHIGTNDLPPDSLIIEITESAAVNERRITMENLTRLRLTGARLSMDDFGAGYASLAQLYRLPFSELKLDRSLIAECRLSKEARVFVRSVTELAHNLGVQVCAEGVETVDSIEFLRTIGCDLAQGFLISKPLGEEELKRFLTRGIYGRSTEIAKATQSARAAAAGA